MDLTRFKECNAYKNSVYIDTHNNVTPCCYFKHKLPLNILQNWNLYKKELEKFDVESGCKYCIDLENSGSAISHRMNFVENVIDISLCVDNLCNLKCTTCNVEASSQWIGDAVKLNFINPDERKVYNKLTEQGPIKLEICKNIIKTANNPVLITFYGGEPTINPAVIDFVDWLTTLTNVDNISLSFITNGTTVLKNINYYFTKFKRITIGVSIDSIEEKNDYLRYGSDWSELKNNLIKYSNLKPENNNFYFYIHYTLSVMNVYYFYEFCNWYNNNLNNCTLAMTKLIGPSYYSVDVLNTNQKLKILLRNINLIDQLVPLGVVNLNTIKNEYKSSVESYLEPNLTSKKTLTMLKSLDNIRNTNFEKTFPEIFQILNSNE